MGFGLHADTLAFWYSGSGVTAEGILTATPQGNGSYLVTGATGTRGAAPITGVLPTPQNVGSNGYSYYYFNDGPKDFMSYDNLAAPSQTPTLDNGGLAFNTAGGPVDLFSQSATYDDAILASPGNFQVTTVTLQIAPAAIFPFEYSGGGVSASGVLYGLPEGNGAYLITAIAGDRNGSPITGLQPTPQNLGSNGNSYFYFNDGPGDFISYDNLLSGSQIPKVDSGGLAFDVAGGPVNLYSQNGGYYDAILTSPGNFQLTPVSFAITPEPSGLSLALAALLGLGVTRRRRNAAR